MNQKTLQSIYRQLETKEFYKRYLVDLGCREDRRSLLQHRPIKVTRSEDGVVLSCGQTILIASMQTSIEHVTYSPLSLTFGEPLLKLHVVTGSGRGRHFHQQSREERAIEQYIESRISWGPIEDQLVNNDLATNKQYAHKGKITLRVLSDDGGVGDYGLLAVQILLHTQTFPDFVIEKEHIEKKGKIQIKIDHMIWPVRCVSVIGKCLLDPSLSEESNCDISVSALVDLKGDVATEVVRHLLKVEQNDEETVKDMLAVCDKRKEQIALRIEGFWRDLQEKGQSRVE